MTEVNDYLPDDQRVPHWLKYPPRLLELIRDGCIDMTPWHILKFKMSLDFSATMSSAYGRNLFAFAHRQYNDDFACFEEGYADNVKIINIGASKGFENEGESSFEKWLVLVQQEMDDWW